VVLQFDQKKSVKKRERMTDETGKLSSEESSAQ
jgi:hypothetical protein